MKSIIKQLSIIFLFILLSGSNLFGQAPEKMSYQAVIRDANNALVTQQLIGVRISILLNSVAGTPVYTETQTVNSNSNGLISIEIGTGTTTDNFSIIDWSNGLYFIKTETDPTGGTNYTITGTSQLLSVPYALHSNTTDSIAGGIVEADPLFLNSVANGITTTDTINWNTDLVNDADNDPTNENQQLSISGDSISISNGNTINLPNRIIRGTVTAGFAPTISAGTGFTVSHSSTGTYIVTFDIPFVNIPSATVSINHSGGSSTPQYIVVKSINNTTLVIRTGSGGTTLYNLDDSINFSFIVIE